MAKSNNSPVARRVYTAIYFRDGCTRASTGRPHPSVDRDSIEVGAAIRGAATPVAWPRGDGDFPLPGPWPDSQNERAIRLRTLGIIPDNRP